MNLKVTITFIVTEEDWGLSESINECSGINSEEAQSLVRSALMEDPLYVIKNSSLSIKQDFESI
jgi:hypothetical protein